MIGPIVEESGRRGTLGHGFTAGGHPVAAAVALENVRIIEERNLVANAAAVGARMRKGLAAYQGHPLVGEVRGVGLIAAVELVTDKRAKAALDPVGKLGGLVNAALLAEGVIIRNMGDTIAFCPPLIITEAQADDMVVRFGVALDKVERSLRLAA